MKHGYLELRKWGELQHYTDRNPPWVKLYPKIIDPRENADLTALGLPARYLAFAMICLAAKTGNLIPASPSWIGIEVGMTTSATRKAIAELRAIGFVRAAGSNGADELASKRADKSAGPREQRTEVGANAPTSGGRDLTWDTMEELFGKAPPGTNAHKRRNKAVADLKKFAASPDSIRSAHRRWHKVFEGAAPTDIGIATHYGRLIHGTIHAEKPSPEKGQVADGLPDVLGDVG